MPIINTINNLDQNDQGGTPPEHHHIPKKRESLVF